MNEQLKGLTKSQLLEVAATRGVIIPSAANKDEIIARLSEGNKVVEKAEVTGYESFDHDELVAIAAEFGVEINPHEDSNVIIANLLDFGVTHEFYKSMHPDVVEEPALAVGGIVKPAVVEPAGEKILIKMTRPNRTFEIRGAKFTKANPFALVSEEDADYIIDVIGGFEVARPSEVAKYYA